MVSCLAVTYNRPQFHDFLLWNFNKQNYNNKELIVIDGSDDDYSNYFNGNNICYIHVKSEPNIPVKRNLALSHAHGDIVTWFDDDDWQHPNKCSILSSNLNSKYSLVGNNRSYFLNIFNSNLSKYYISTPLFNSIGIKKELALKVKFNDNHKIASDSYWLQNILSLIDNDNVKIIDTPILFIWLSHNNNISNSISSKLFNDTEFNTQDTLFCDEGNDLKAHIESIITKSNNNLPTINNYLIDNVLDLKITNNISNIHKRNSTVLVGVNVWNQYKEAAATVNSLIQSNIEKGIVPDILIVDDCSDDIDIQPYFNKMADQNKLIYLRNETQLKLTRSWNVLLSFGVSLGYDYIVQSNADVRFPKGWLDRLVLHLKNGVEYIVPLTNNPGRHAHPNGLHNQDIRRVLKYWKDDNDINHVINETQLNISNLKEAEAISSANGFFIGFRRGFLERIKLSPNIYWSEDSKYLMANRGIGGDESEIRKRTNVQIYLAKDVFIYHTRPYGSNGLSRDEYLKKMKH